MKITATSQEKYGKERKKRVKVNRITQLLLLSHYADWAGPQPRLWFAEQEKNN